MVDSWLQDLRYALRLLRRNPIFALAAAVSLALGIGATTTIFTIANALLFRAPVGVLEPRRLVDIGRSQDGNGFDNNSYPNYLDIRSRTTTLASIYAYRFGSEPMSLGGPGGAERINGDLVTLDYFATLGTKPAIGRLFSRDDSEQAGASPLAVLSYRFWQTHFNGDPSIIGRPLTINGQPFTVIGVTPEHFHGTTILTSDVWLPMSMIASVSPRLDSSILASRASSWLVMGGRLKPGVSLAQARAELEGIGRSLEREFPDANRGRGVRVVSSSPIPGNGGPVAAFLAMLMAIVALVLAIACVNLAGVLFARATARRREIAVRLAIGAARWRLVRQLLVETVILFAIGTTLGLLLARVMTTALVSMIPALPVPIDLTLPLDGTVVLFTVTLSLVAAVLSGLAPALHSSRAELILGLKSDAQGGPEKMRLRNAFVISQVAFSIVLIVAAGLFVRALQHTVDIDPGFDVHGVELAGLDLSLGGYTPATGRVFASDLVARVRQLPRVESAALAAMVPLGNGGLSMGGLAVPGRAAPVGDRFAEVDWNVVTPGYFGAMKLPLVRGRDFDDGDRESSPWVIVVNETFARRFWAGEDAIGKTLLQQTGTRANPDATRTLTVVGVARNAKYRSLGEDRRPFVYVPMAQQYLPRTVIVARARDGQRLASEMRGLLASMNPNLPIVEAQTLEEFASVGLVPQRVAASVSGSVGIVGLLLAGIGIYGVTAYMVSSRTREIGIRIALGAQRSAVVRMVLAQGMRLALTGMAIGLVLAAAGSRLIASQLFGIQPTDPLTFVASTAVLGAVGLIACYAPARRATSIAASEALRSE